MFNCLLIMQVEQAKMGTFNLYLLTIKEMSNLWQLESEVKQKTKTKLKSQVLLWIEYNLALLLWIQVVRA